MEVSAILQDIQRGALALPLFQRGYVWTRDDVKAFIRSLYRGYPVGGLLVWGTTAGSMGVRSSGQMLEAGAVDLLLDGQQRMTTLYGIIRGGYNRIFSTATKGLSRGCTSTWQVKTRKVNAKMVKSSHFILMPKCAPSLVGSMLQISFSEVQCQS